MAARISAHLCSACSQNVPDHKDDCLAKPPQGGCHNYPQTFMGDNYIPAIAEDIIICNTQTILSN